jgi:hypothetical protein
VNGDAWDERRRTQLVDLDAATWSIVEQVAAYTLTSVERIAALCASVDYIVKHDIPGAFVECGLWKGGSMMAMALRLRDLDALDRELVGFDTFTGMTEPSELDVDYQGQSALAQGWAPSTESEPGRSMDEVRSAILSTGYSPAHVTLVRGPVEETLPASAPDSVALLRLDTDWYASTRHELLHLYPRLTIGGVLIVDDYGHYQGARKAVDEYFHDRRVLLHRIDYTGRIAVRQGQ